MKNIIACLVLALIILPADSFAGASTTTTGGTPYQGEPPTSLPIATKGMLQSFALTQVRRGHSSIWSEALLTSFDEVRYVNVNGTDADDVVKKLSESQTFRVRTYDKTKPVHVWSYLRNADGDELFYTSFVQVTTVETPSGLVIQGSQLTFQPARTPIYFPNATSARIEHVGADGSRWTESLDVYGSKIYFPPNYAGTGGVLIVTTSYPQGGPSINPGESVDTAYGLRTGDKLPTTSITGGATFAIENHLYGSDTGYAPSTMLVLSGKMTPPVDPSVNWWQIISPPTCTFNVHTLVGMKRMCRLIITMPSTVAKIGAINAWAYTDSNEMERGGTVTTSTYGDDVTITVTWALDNDAGMSGGANWHCYLEIEGFEKQGPPQPPYYGGKG